MSANGWRVLIVDDESTIADTLGLIFSRDGFDARTAYSAEHATEITTAWIPNLILIDVVLPGMNGIDLAIRIRDQFPACHTLLFSGMIATADMLAQAAQRGYRFEVLAKPMQPTELLEIARRLFETDLSKQLHTERSLETIAAPGLIEPILENISEKAPWSNLTGATDESDSDPAIWRGGAIRDRRGA